MATAHAPGAIHDFKLYKESQIELAEEIAELGDKGYDGLEKLHPNSRTPKKKPKGGELTKEAQLRNREINRARIVIEHIIRSLKIFRILAERYRNRRKRFSLRFNLIAGIYNYSLEH